MKNLHVQLTEKHISELYRLKGVIEAAFIFEPQPENGYYLLIEKIDELYSRFIIQFIEAEREKHKTGIDL